MLTDYHVHLRPDDPGTPAEEYFTPGQRRALPGGGVERGIAELGVTEHIHRFSRRSTSGATPSGSAEAHDDLDSYCDFVREETTCS